MILSHATGRKWNQRQPEQQVQIGPQQRAIDVRDQVKEVMVVIPVDRDVDEAQHIAEKHRRQRQERIRARILRHLQLQHHDRNNDGNDAVGERKQPLLCTVCSLAA